MRLKAERIFLHVGLERPIRILQISDVHLSLADEVDGDGMKEHARQRRREFVKEANYPERDPVGYFEEAMEYAEQFDCTVLTGDLLDFVSHANCEVARKILSGRDYMFCAGNHEFCPKVGTPDSFARKEALTEEVQSLFCGNIFFDSRIVGGLNVITLDNGYYTWTEEQLEGLKREVARGLPCVIFCHVPPCAAHMRHDPSHKDLPVSEEERDFIRSVTEYIVNEPMIKAVFSGHLHVTGTTALHRWDEGSGADAEGGQVKTDYTLGALFKGIVGEITVD